MLCTSAPLWHQVGTLITRYVSRPLREWAAAQAARREAHKHGSFQQQQAATGGKKRRRQPQPLPNGRLRVSENGRSLVIEPGILELPAQRQQVAR